MKYQIILAPGAVEDLKLLRTFEATAVRDRIRRHLGSRPTVASRTRIKRLRGISKPQYRLRVGEVRVFYDVEGVEVHILAIVPKSRSQEWLEREGVKT